MSTRHRLVITPRDLSARPALGPDRALVVRLAGGLELVDKVVKGLIAALGVSLFCIDP